ncbi:hypothetical protein Dda_1429 [Drechslerella dactyloides]|uniref:Uncharacterized protein n=1 Tax=Drechslerella dactyloides TaxID=74499 RepID=A0AAD6J669_DREDA|nr:hypothetical protein Dda_1429 [Drechslerella dactyloides]
MSPISAASGVANGVAAANYEYDMDSASGGWYGYESPRRLSSTAYESGKPRSCDYTLIHKLYECDYEDVDVDSMEETPPSPEGILVHKFSQVTPAYRSFEGWGFGADDPNNMEPTERKRGTRTNVPGSQVGDGDMLMRDVDPLYRMDETVATGPNLPSIVVSEAAMFDHPSESTGRSSDDRCSSSELSKGSTSSNNGDVVLTPFTYTTISPKPPMKAKKSLLSFLLRRKPKAKKAQISQPRRLGRRLLPPSREAEMSSIDNSESTPEIETATEATLIRVERLAGEGGHIPSIRISSVMPTRPEHRMRRASITLRVEDDEIFDIPTPVQPHQERCSSPVNSQHDLMPLQIRRNSSFYNGDDSRQPGDDLSPPSSPRLGPARRYSETHLSHPGVYSLPRANWYRSDWGLDDNTELEAEARSITSHAVAVKVAPSRQASRWGSMDVTVDVETDKNGMGIEYASEGRRESSGDARMEDLSRALREALQMDEMSILEEEEDDALSR